MRKRLVILAVTAVGAVGVVAAPASADPLGTFCHSVKVTVNGSDLVNDSACNVLPPEAG
jgi:hypothetical protein